MKNVILTLIVLTFATISSAEQKDNMTILNVGLKMLPTVSSWPMIYLTDGTSKKWCYFTSSLIDTYTTEKDVLAFIFFAQQNNYQLWVECDNYSNTNPGISKIKLAQRYEN